MSKYTGAIQYLVQQIAERHDFNVKKFIKMQAHEHTISFLLPHEKQGDKLS